MFRRSVFQQTLNDILKEVFGIHNFLKLTPEQLAHVRYQVKFVADTQEDGKFRLGAIAFRNELGGRDQIVAWAQQAEAIDNLINSTRSL